MENDIRHAILPDGTSWICTKEGETKAWELWRRIVAVLLPRNEGIRIARLGSDIRIMAVCAPILERVIISLAPTGEVSNMSDANAPEIDLFFPIV